MRKSLIISIYYSYKVLCTVVHRTAYGGVQYCVRLNNVHRTGDAMKKKSFENVEKMVISV